MVDAKLNIPVFNPELQVWRSPLSQKLIITGPVGVNHELIELHNNFPRFHLLHEEGQYEEEILARVRKQGTQILENLRKLRAENDHLFLSREEDELNESHFDESTFTPNGYPIEDESRPSKPVSEPTDSTASVALDEKESQSNLDTEIEQ